MSLSIVVYYKENDSVLCELSAGGQTLAEKIVSGSTQFLEWAFMPVEGE